jgi:hypothetical protein
MRNKLLILLATVLGICPVAFTRPSNPATVTSVPTVFATDDTQMSARVLSLSYKDPSDAQQVGFRCVARPQCPDCTGGGNVCPGVEEFYPGITMLVAKKNIIYKCQHANGLDYCGGSRGCMKLKPEERKRHMERYGGGCYRQCEKVAVCIVDNR